MSKKFDPSSIQSFRFTRWSYDNEQQQLSLHYAFDNQFRFVEEIRLPATSAKPGPEQTAALKRCFDLLHLVAGISYYKAAIPKNIVIEDQQISAGTSAFLENVYKGGLGEFAFENNLQLHKKIEFPSVENAIDTPSELALSPSKTLVPVGGGKDSIVSIESLKSSGIDLELFSVGSAQPIINTANKSGLPHLQASRKISPQLLELNQLGAYNGHVPITAIVSLIALATAILHGHSDIAFSNERSANIGNMTLDDGFEVNHQFSKSYLFEQKLAEQITRSITPSIQYFSLLRPYSELHIAKSFTQNSNYDEIFTSCNSNFTQSKKSSPQLWCCDCPKCRFVFLMLAAFMDKERILNIFGSNLLNDPTQRPGFDALLGIEAHKPFECVGEYEESLAALQLISKKDEWKGDLLVEHYRRTLLDRVPNIDSIVQRYLTPENSFRIPEKHLSAVRAYFQMG